MQIPERRTPGPGFERRLKIALDSITPRTPHHFNARYRGTMWVRSRRSYRPWRLAPALMGLAAVGIMGLSAVAATGSSNPAVWTQRAASTIHAVSHIPENAPNPPPAPAPDPRGTAPVSQQPVTSHPTQASGHQTEAPDKAKATAKAQETARPDESPRPTDHPNSEPSPSSKPSETPPHDSTPSPPPHDSGGH